MESIFMVFQPHSEYCSYTEPVVWKFFEDMHEALDWAINYLAMMRPLECLKENQLGVGFNDFDCENDIYVFLAKEEDFGKFNNGDDVYYDADYSLCISRIYKHEN